MRNDPITTAKELIERGYTELDYRSIQDQREKRLEFWQDHGIDYLIEREKLLIEYGQKVLNAMREINL